MSNNCVSSFESHYSSSGRIQFQNTSSIDGEESPPIERETWATLRTWKRYERNDSVYTEETWTYFSKEPEFFKALASLHSELTLDCTAIGIEYEYFLREEVNLSLCRYGPIKIVSNPAADSSLGVVEGEVWVNERQRCCLNADFYFVFRALRDSDRSECDDSEKEEDKGFQGRVLRRTVYFWLRYLLPRIRLMNMITNRTLEISYQIPTATNKRIPAIGMTYSTLQCE